MVFKREFSLFEIVTFSLIGAILAFIAVQRYLEVVEKARMSEGERYILSEIRASSAPPPPPPDMSGLDIPYGRIARNVVGLRYRKQTKAASASSSSAREGEVFMRAEGVRK